MKKSLFLLLFSMTANFSFAEYYISEEYCYLRQAHLKNLDKVLKYCGEGDIVHLEGLMTSLVSEICRIETIVTATDDIILCEYRGSRRDHVLKDYKD